MCKRVVIICLPTTHQYKKQPIYFSTDTLISIQIINLINCCDVDLI